MLPEHLIAPAAMVALPPSEPSYARRSQVSWSLPAPALATILEVLGVPTSSPVEQVGPPPLPEAFRAGTSAMRAIAATDDVDNTDWLVRELHRLARTRALQYTLEVGRLVVSHVYGGNLTAVGERGRRDASYRQLARRRDLPFSAVTLWRCVKIYELVEQFPMVLQMPHLSLAHLRAVAALPSPKQRTLLERASDQAWTSDELVRVVRRDRATGRPSPPATLARKLQRLLALAADLQLELQSAPEVLGLSEPERASLLVALGSLTTIQTGGARAGEVAERSSGVHRVNRTADPDQY